MLVFRENRVAVSTHLLVRVLAESLASTDPDALLDALLRAGELECALADAGSSAAPQVANVTDALARQVVNGRSYDAPSLAHRLSQNEVPARVKISPPEGFAYYALHPLSYAKLALKWAGTSSRIAVIGIRSIGTTLAAIVAAAFDGRGVPAQRISVRPTGHPFDRITHFSREEFCWVERERDHAAQYLVVDEGPGLSGSSLLSVGEALLRAGVERSRIAFLCSHEPNPELLRAYNGAERWLRFETRAVGGGNSCSLAFVAKNASDVVELSGGKWRELLYPDRTHWPASWRQMERLKFLSPDKKLLFKFEGLGRFGSEVVDRARVISDAGFANAPQHLHDGFAVYPWIRSVSGDPAGVSQSFLDRLAEYCAFCTREFRVPANGSKSSLSEMVRCNVGEEFGFEPDLDDSALCSQAPIVPDGRMQPHEWLQSDGGVWLKVDGVAHGDDHFFPGPTDIAWDLAGAIIEWHFDQHAREYFLARYRRLSDDDPTSRLPSFLLAYTASRLGYCKMAAESVHDEQERERLTRDYHRYRALLHAYLPEARLKFQASSR